MPQIEVVAWDLDGTLYQANPQLDQAIQHAIYDAIAQSLGFTQKKAVEYYQKAKHQLKSSTKVLDQAGINGRTFFIDLWLKLPLEQYIHPNWELQQLFVQSTTQSPRRHMILTNSNTHQTVRRKLNCLGIPVSTFSEILTSVDLKVEKPDLKAFEILVKTAKVPPQNILYVGDRVEVDLVPAKKVGLHTCLVTFGTEAKKNISGIDIIFETPMQVLHALLDEAAQY